MAHAYRPIDQRIARAIIEEATERAERDENGCLIWPDRLDANGYGITAWGGFRAHRLAYVAAYHDPGALMVRHEKCGNPSCFDYEHLAEGDAAANNEDTRRMGRHRPKRALTNDQAAHAADLVNDGMTVTAVAAAMGVGQSTLTRHLDGLLDAGVNASRHLRKVSDEDVLAARHDLAAKRATIRQISDRLGISWPAAQKMVQGRTYEHVGGPLAPRSPGAKLSKRERIEARRLRVAGLHPEHIAARLGATRAAVDAALVLGKESSRNDG